MSVIVFNKEGKLVRTKNRNFEGTCTYEITTDSSLSLRKVSFTGSERDLKIQFNFTNQKMAVKFYKEYSAYALDAATPCGIPTLLGTLPGYTPEDGRINFTISSVFASFDLVPFRYILSKFPEFIYIIKDLNASVSLFNDSIYELLPLETFPVDLAIETLKHSEYLTRVLLQHYWGLRNSEEKSKERVMTATLPQLHQLAQSITPKNNYYQEAQDIIKKIESEVDNLHRESASSRSPSRSASATTPARVYLGEHPNALYTQLSQDPVTKKDDASIDYKHGK